MEIVDTYSNVLKEFLLKNKSTPIRNVIRNKRSKTEIHGRYNFLNHGCLEIHQACWKVEYAASWQTSESQKNSDALKNEELEVR